MDVTYPSESLLIERSRAHDPEAFATLVEHHKDRLIGYLTRMTGCRDRAEEVAQETFVRLFQTLDRFDDQGNLAAYLFRIATNLVRSEERRKRRWRLLTPFLGHHKSTAQSSPSREALASEEQRQVQAALGALELPFRAPLVLREIEGLSYGEIAKVLETSEGTVKSRIHRGKQKLKERLAPYWNGERQ